MTRGAVSESLVFYGSFLKSGGGQGRSPAVSIPEFILTFMKNNLFILFLALMDDLAETRESSGGYKSPVFYGSF